MSNIDRLTFKNIQKIKSDALRRTWAELASLPITRKEDAMLIISLQVLEVAVLQGNLQDVIANFPNTVERRTAQSVNLSNAVEDGIAPL